jgi:transcriptional regulator with XRE-family HTH domain
MKIRDRLLKRFHSFKYRHGYLDEFTDAYIATQIKVLREERRLNQTALGKLAGMKQSQISELEDVNNRGWKVRTLKKLAKAFDLALVVRFEEFGRVLPDIGNLDRKHLERAAFKDDPVFCQADEATTSPSDAITAHAKVGRVLNAYAKFGKGDISNVA